MIECLIGLCNRGALPRSGWALRAESGVVGVATEFNVFVVQGAEHLPKDGDEACIVVANHQSLLDPFIIANLNFNFRCAIKRELVFYPCTLLVSLWCPVAHYRLVYVLCSPWLVLVCTLVMCAVVGQALVLSGSLVVKRGDRESGHRLIEKAMESIKQGINVLFFPEGTRKIDASKGPLGEFKAGAFKVRRGAVELLVAGRPWAPVSASNHTLLHVCFPMASSSADCSRLSVPCHSGDDYWSTVDAAPTGVSHARVVQPDYRRPPAHQLEGQGRRHTQ
jgi:hypothetical protein